MLIRVHPAMTVLYSTRRTTIGELGNFAGTAVRDLYRYVADLDLLVCGPQYWFYYDPDGRPMTAGDGPPFKSGSRFTLEIALPVQGQIPTTLLPWFKQIPSFKCLSSRYEGPWEGMPAIYSKMMEHIAAQGLSMNGMVAESFLHIDFPAPKNNITEIQIGLL